MTKVLLLSIIIGIGLHSNAQSIIGKWKVVAMEKDGEKIPMEETALRNYIYTSALKEKEKDSVPTLTAEDSSGIEMAITMIQKSVGTMVLQFDENKKLTISYAKKKELETYSYNATTKQLITTNAKKKTKKFKVTLTANELILDNSKLGNEGIMYLERKL